MGNLGEYLKSDQMGIYKLFEFTRERKGKVSKVKER